MMFLIFDVSGDHAHYRKYNSTSSPVTYSIPTRTATMGMVAAILGYDYNEYTEKLNSKNFQCAIQIKNAIKKKFHGYNILQGDNFRDNSIHSQVAYEFIESPKYRIYVTMNDETLDELRDRIIQKNYHYSPYLGLAFMHANIEYVGYEDFYEVNNINSDLIPILTAINIEKNPIRDWDKNYSAHYVLDNMPIEIKTDNIGKIVNKHVTKYAEVLTEINSNLLVVNIEKYLKSDEYGYNITTL